MRDVHARHVRVSIEHNLEREENTQSFLVDDEQKATSLMFGEHLINLTKSMTEKEISEILQRTEPEHKLKQRKNP
jgi:hypothetical protein